MATYHVTSTDEDPHHDLRPEGADSWCPHNASKVNGVPPPKHKYNLPGWVAEALLPVYQRLSKASLLQRCLGAKTQNASESFHSVLWSLMLKEQHASLIAVETALHEAVLRFNAGCYRATQELPSSVGLTPGHLTNQGAAEKDSLRYAHDDSDTVDQTCNIVDQAYETLLAEVLEEHGVTEGISFPDFRDIDSEVQTSPD
ncbi:hypothetical protein HPB52_000924 [Rhipicephalus sanguineus]|uniref:Uncharacterized protein n=1 Tax=Rhipicephalus sanguineus TaxID=34632 RepID=A0A9D4SXA1_RHISA|nr:hypothetical protein HPB52_000924 [Rhipicephalus sanguineus]